MQRATIVVLRVLIAVFAIGLLFVQAVYLPWVASEMVSDFPEFAYLRVPFLVLGILTLACVEATVVAVWLLLSRVAAGRVFARDSFRYVDVIVTATALATVLVAATGLWSGVVEPQPSVVLLLAGGTVAGAALTLLMVVMRSLLSQASRLEADLSEVI